MQRWVADNHPRVVAAMKASPLLWWPVIAARLVEAVARALAAAQQVN